MIICVSVRFEEHGRGCRSSFRGVNASGNISSITVSLPRNRDLLCATAARVRDRTFGRAGVVRRRTRLRGRCELHIKKVSVAH